MFFIYHILTYLHMDTIYIVKELTIARNTRIQMQEYKNNYKQYIITKIIIDTLFRVWCITICMNAKYWSYKIKSNGLYNHAIEIQFDIVQWFSL